MFLVVLCDLYGYNLGRFGARRGFVHFDSMGCLRVCFDVMFYFVDLNWFALFGFGDCTFGLGIFKVRMVFWWFITV